MPFLRGKSIADNCPQSHPRLGWIIEVPIDFRVNNCKETNLHFYPQAEVLADTPIDIRPPNKRGENGPIAEKYGGIPRHYLHNLGKVGCVSLT